MSSESLHIELRKLFEQQYYLITEMEFYWTAKDSANLKQLITKLTFHVKKKKENHTDKDIKEAYQLILNCISQIPQLKFYKENFTIPLINSHLNQIISIIKTNGIKKDRGGNIAKAIDTEIARRSVGINK